MKIFISADIEGVAGIAAWGEAQRQNPAYREFQQQMTAEVRAACEAALAAGAREILVKDAHAGANNLTAGALPAPTRLVRGWSGHPYGMVQGLEAGFDAALFIGYHGRAGAGGNPLAHTVSSRKVQELRLDGEPASEYRIHALAAALEDVPVVFVSGDQTLCEEVKAFNPAVETYATKWGEGPSQESVHPQVAQAGIRDGVARALAGDPARARLPRPGRTVLEIVYKEPAHAYPASHYPGAQRTAPNTLRFESEHYFEILRALLFLV